MGRVEGRRGHALAGEPRLRGWTLRVRCSARLQRLLGVVNDQALANAPLREETEGLQGGGGVGRRLIDFAAGGGGAYTQQAVKP